MNIYKKKCLRREGKGKFMIFILGSKLNPIHKYFIAKIESKVQVFIFIFPQTRVA